MWCIQGTVTTQTEKGEISPQFATFYLHPECNAGSKEAAIAVATSILNPTEDPNIMPNVSAHLVTVEALNEWTEEEARSLDPLGMTDTELAS
jgi:hypothetical protein